MRHPYGITAGLNKYGDRETAINKLCEKLLVPALVPGTINEKLEKTKEKLKQTNETLEKTAARCNQLMLTAQELAKTAEQYNQLTVTAQELAKTAKENEAMIAQQNKTIVRLENRLQTATDKIIELTNESSFYKTTTAGFAATTGGLAVAVGYIVINAKLKS
jgi:predicted RNase H-like nuclease (RuvC/YqgF family)